MACATGKSRFETLLLSGVADPSPRARASLSARPKRDGCFHCCRISRFQPSPHATSFVPSCKQVIRLLHQRKNLRCFSEPDWTLGVEMGLKCNIHSYPQPQHAVETRLVVTVALRVMQAPVSGSGQDTLSRAECSGSLSVMSGISPIPKPLSLNLAVKLRGKEFPHLQFLFPYRWTLCNTPTPRARNEIMGDKVLPAKVELPGRGPCLHDLMSSSSVQTPFTSFVHQNLSLPEPTLIVTRKQLEDS